MTEARSRSARKSWLGILIGVLLTLVVIAGVALYAVGCAIGKVADAVRTDTKIAARATTANGLELELSYGTEVTGIVTITVTDADGEILWEVAGQGGSSKPAKVVYGELPADGSLKQVFPADGKPPPDIRGQTVQVRIVNRFQVAFGPGQEVTDLTVEMPK